MNRSFLCLGLFVATALGALGCEGEAFTSNESASSASSSADSSATTGTGGAGGAGGASAASTGGAGGGAQATSTTSSASGTGGSGPVCGPIGDLCADCTYGACETQYCACFGDSDCTTLINCLNTCGPNNDPCQQTCLSAPMADAHAAEAFLLGDCAATSCGTECPGTVPLDGCSKCLFTTCPAEMGTCLANPECAAILRCVQMTCVSGDLVCALGCSTAHPMGSQDAQALTPCLQQCSDPNDPSDCG